MKRKLVLAFAAVCVALFMSSTAHANDLPKPTLPFVLYDEDTGGAVPYPPSGWMGNIDAIKVDRHWTDNPHSGTTCFKMDYTETSNWAGVVWQNPENDWGAVAGGYNITGAKKLTFWARGQRGGELITFSYGLYGADKKFPDSSTGKTDVTLTTSWQQYSIDLTGKDLSCIKTGFAWSFGATGQPVTFFVDDIQYE